MRSAVRVLALVAIAAIAHAEPGTGTVIVSCNEADASLLVDDVLIPDRTPAVLTLAAGTHVIEARKPPLLAQKKVITVGDQQQVKLRFELVPPAPPPEPGAGSAAPAGSGSGSAAPLRSTPAPSGSGSAAPTTSGPAAPTGSGSAAPPAVAIAPPKPSVPAPRCTEGGHEVECLQGPHCLEGGKVVPCKKGAPTTPPPLAVPAGSGSAAAPPPVAAGSGSAAAAPIAAGSGSAATPAIAAAAGSAAPAEAAHVPGAATIEIATSVPHAIAYVDGAPLQDAPCIVEVEPGEHVVAVYAAGMVPAETVVRAVADQRQRVELAPSQPRRRIDVPVQ